MPSMKPLVASSKENR